MKKILKPIAFILIFVLLFLAVIIALPDQFAESYQRALVRQYNYYKNLEGNKLTFVGSSGLAFGLNLDLMEELTGEQCALLGNHNGFGLAYQLEMSKCNLEAGDIVVVDYSNYTYDSGESLLLLSAIGKNYEMHRFFTPVLCKVKILPGYSAYFQKALCPRCHSRRVHPCPICRR